MDIKIVNRVYNTKGDELLRYVRYEVMEGLEIRELIEDTDEDKYDALVKDVMERVRVATKAIVDNIL